jgi:hypothetical protein
MANKKQNQMRETILLDALRKIKKECASDYAIDIATKALTDWASAPKEGLRWVKASERLPEKKGLYTTKRPTLNEKEFIVKEEIFNPKYEDIKEKWISFEYEWLDESSAPESGQNCYKNGLELAKKFHELYEKNAPNYGYETRKETREFNEDTPNGKLMIAVCEQILASLPAPESGQQSDEPLWYIEDHLYDYLIQQNYSKEIAKELAKLWADGFQGAFKKGWEMGRNKDKDPDEAYQYLQKMVAPAPESGGEEKEIRQLIKTVFMEAQKGGGYTKETEDYFLSQFSSLSKEQGKDEKDLEQSRIDYYEDKIDMLNRIYKEETERLKGLIEKVFRRQFDTKMTYEQFAKENGLKGE